MQRYQRVSEFSAILVIPSPSLSLFFFALSFGMDRIGTMLVPCHAMGLVFRV